MRTTPRVNQFVSNRTLTAVLLLLSSAPLLAFVPQGSNTKPVIFKTPSGYMPAELSGHTGKLLLDPGKPAGMFVGYPKDGQDMAAFTEEIKQMIVKMFLHEGKNPEWTLATSLPSHKGIESEAGSLMTTSDNDMEVQLAFYTRPEGMAYGYFGMRHKKSKSDDAKFLDVNGVGVKAFDELAKSISSKH